MTDTTRPVAIPDAAVEAADSYLITQDTYAIRYQVRGALAAAYPHIRAAILAEVKTLSSDPEKVISLVTYVAADGVTHIGGTIADWIDNALLDAMKEATDE